MRYHDAMTDALPPLSILPSRRLKWALALLHGLAASALAGLDGWLAAVTLPGVVASFVWYMRARTPGAALRCRQDGSLQVRIGADWCGASLLGDTVVLAWLVVLRYRVAQGSSTETRVILADSLAAEDFRRLRVWLRWRARIADRPRDWPGHAPA